MTYDLILLGRDPWSRDYWKRLGPLPTAMLALVERDDAEPYMRYWLKKYPQWAEHAASRERGMRLLVESLRAGYDTERWRLDPRGLKPEDGAGPMCCSIAADGTLWPMDGAHRSSILRALGEPVHLHVYRRAPYWAERRTTDRYAKHPDAYHVSGPVPRR